MIKLSNQNVSSGPTARLATALMLASLAMTGPLSTAMAQGSAAAAYAPDVVGVWVDHTQQGAVEIKQCGERLCGYVVWMQKATDDKTGQPLTDAQNPDPTRRKVPMCGLQIIGDAAPARNGRGFENGWIYNPDDGVRYDVDVTPKSKDQILVHGYAGIRLLGETFTWTRAPETLQRCKA